MKADFRNSHFLCIIIIRIFFQNQELAFFPFREKVGSVGLNIPGFCPPGSVFPKCGAVQGTVYPQTCHSRKIGSLICQGEFDSIIIQGDHTQPGGVSDFPGTDCLTVFQHIKGIHVIGVCSEQDIAADSPYHIMGSDRFPVCPCDISAQVKSADFAVFAHGPVRCQFRNRFIGFRGKIRESQKQLLAEFYACLIIDQSRIKGGNVAFHRQIQKTRHRGRFVFCQ